VKDIQKDLIENAPSKGSQTDMDTEKSDETQNGSFETIAPEKDNPGKREFEIEELGREQKSPLRDKFIKGSKTGCKPPGANP
jgi:hypothetical protein